MIIETIIATLIGVIVSRLYIEHYYILVKKSGITAFSVYSNSGELIRTIDKETVAEYLREEG